MISATRVGVCNWIFGAASLAKTAGKLARMGFGGVQLSADYERDSPKEVSEIFADWGLHIFSLTPMNVDLAHPQARFRRAASVAYEKMLDFAAAMEDAPLVCVHGRVGRYAAFNDDDRREYDHLVESLSALAEGARARRLRLVYEVLNRYESHLVNTSSQATRLLADVGALNLGILLDGYHMNIEEADPARAIQEAGAALWLYHAADSNRRGLGKGNSDWSGQLAALADIGYTGPIILEINAPGPNPFQANKRGDWRAELDADLRESLRRLTS